MYALIHNDQIEVGPRDWLWSAFQEYLVDNGLDITALPKKSPSNPIVTDQWKLLPVNSLEQPSYVYPYEALAGPFLTINENDVTATWSVAPLNIEFSKAYLKDVVTQNRYTAEVAGFKMTVQSEEVSIDTARGSRDIFFQTYLSMDNTDTVNWKFPETWLTLSKTDLGMIVVAGKAHIQNCFDWEKTQWAAIDACSTRAELEAVALVPTGGA